jgi:hypothetical protein
VDKLRENSWTVVEEHEIATLRPSPHVEHVDAAPPVFLMGFMPLRQQIPTLLHIVHMPTMSTEFSPSFINMMIHEDHDTHELFQTIPG